MTTARKPKPREPLGTWSGKLNARVLVKKLIDKRTPVEKRAAALRCLNAVNANVDIGSIDSYDRKALVNICGYPNGRIEVKGGSLIARSGKNSCRLDLFEYMVAAAAANLPAHGHDGARPDHGPLFQAAQA